MRRTIVNITVMCHGHLCSFKYVHLYNNGYNSIELIQFIFNCLYIFITYNL